MNVWWSVVLAAVGITGLLLAGAKRPSGWLVGLGAQVLWFVYAVVTGQWGFIASAVAYGVVYGLNYWRWLSAPVQSPGTFYARQGPALQAARDEGYRAGVEAGQRDWQRGATVDVWPKSGPGDEGDA